MSGVLIAVILGIVEGVTEFLPISSTGHLILVNHFLEFTGGFADMFDVVIQLGAILSVVVFFRHKLFPFGKHKSISQKHDIWQLWKKTIVGVIPAILIGATLGQYVQDVLFNPYVVAVALVVGGIILLLIDGKKRRGRYNSIAALPYQTAFFIGLIQCLAMIPGTSRSAATIIGAMLLGTSRVVAAEYSFFLAIPTMLAASAYTLYDKGMGISSNEVLLLVVGFVVSFVVALAVIAAFMNYISKRDFKPFAYYRIVLGILVLIYFGLIL